MKTNTPVEKSAEKKNEGVGIEDNLAEGSATGDSPSSGESVRGDTSVDQIRNILFGTQSRDFEKRFVSLEARIERGVADLKEETSNRIDSLESYIKKELKAIGERISEEKKDRSESLREVSDEARKMKDSLEKKIVELNESLSRKEQDLRGELLDQSKKLSDEIRKKNNSLAAEFENTHRELRTDTIDRATFAKLLTKMAMEATREIPEQDSPESDG